MMIESEEPGEFQGLSRHIGKLGKVSLQAGNLRQALSVSIGWMRSTLPPRLTIEICGRQPPGFFAEGPRRGATA